MNGYLRHLATFAHVVDAGSITAAAGRLGGSPSSVSESVKVLEAHLGEVLLERRRSGVVPTGRGLEIYAEAREIVAALNRALGPREDEAPATLRISVPSELSQGWFHLALDQIGQVHPEIQLVLMVEDGLVDHTKYARDLHIRAGKKETRPGMTELASGQTRAVMACASGLLPSDASAEQVQAEVFLCKPRASREAVITLGSGTQLRFQRTLQASSVTIRIALARAGLGVVTCLQRSLAQDFTEGRMTRLLPDAFDMPVHISITSPHRKPPKAAQLVAEALGAALG